MLTRHGAHIGCWGGLLAVMFGLMTGCAPGHVEDPIPVMMNTELGLIRRMAAAEQAEQELRNDPRRLKALDSLVWGRGNPAELRNYAVDQLIAQDEAKFRAEVAKRVTLIGNWDTLTHVMERAGERGWTELTPAIVRSYARVARGASDQERPERVALEKLHPGKPVERVVFDVFVDADEQVAAVDQVAAWELLARLSAREELLKWLGQSGGGSSAFVADLRLAAAELHVIPINKEGVLWLTTLRQPEHAADWAAARQVVGELDAPRLEKLELRHLRMLRAGNPWMKLDRAALAAEVEGLLKTREHALEGPNFDGPMKEWPQTFRLALPQLSWADLVTIRVLLDVVERPAVVAEVFRQAEADLLDTSSEHGGVLDFSGESVADAGVRAVAKAYEPLARKHDLTYLPAPAMIEHLYTALAHYHFHAQKWKSADHAGPGRGDLATAQRLNFNFLVFTALDENRINVDYYQPDGTVVDLTTLRRQ